MAYFSRVGYLSFNNQLDSHRAHGLLEHLWGNIDGGWRMIRMWEGVGGCGRRRNGSGRGMGCDVKHAMKMSVRRYFGYQMSRSCCRLHLPSFCFASVKLDLCCCLRCSCFFFFCFCVCIMLIAGSQFGIITCTGPIAKDYQKRALVSKYECCCLLIYVLFFRF